MIHILVPAVGGGALRQCEKRKVALRCQRVLHQRSACRPVIQNGPAIYWLTSPTSVWSANTLARPSRRLVTSEADCPTEESPLIKQLACTQGHATLPVPIGFWGSGPSRRPAKCRGRTGNVAATAAWSPRPPRGKPSPRSLQQVNTASAQPKPPPVWPARPDCRSRTFRVRCAAEGEHLPQRYAWGGPDQLLREVWSAGHAACSGTTRVSYRGNTHPRPARNGGTRPPPGHPTADDMPA